MNRRSSYSSSHHSKLSSKSQSFSHPTNRDYREDDEDDNEIEDIDVELEESDDDDDDDEDYDAYHSNKVSGKSYPTRHPKKRRLASCNSGYESPRRGVRNSQPNWAENATLALLEIWGDRFLQLGRSSLRNEDWSEVAERVSEATRMNFSVVDCRNRLSFLKDKYKKEKARLEALGGGNSKWVYFKKMDVLMTISPRQEQQCGLACGVDSGEYVFMNPRVYLDHSNALDEMRDSPGNSESEDEDEDDFRGNEESESYRLLSDSIKKVGEIYEKIENTKRQHMMELERMRMEFQRDLELQKKEMIERTRAEIEKMRQDEDDDSDCSENSVSE
ncbi:hypothetical protein Ancab_028723 [Ancistrocladus abbreviatus]